MMRSAALLLVPSLVLVAAGSPRKTPSHRKGTASTAGEAKAVAEQETGGRAVGVRRIPLNGASGGWEVDVHMPKEERGWRCIIDADTHAVHSKGRIPNPAPPGKRR